MAYVPDSTAGKLSIVDTATGTNVGEIVIGRDPRSVAIHPDGSTLFVGNWETRSLSVIDVRARMERANIPLSSMVQAVAVKPDGSRVYVTNGNAVTVVNTQSNSVSATIPVDGSPRGIIVSRSGQFAYTSNSAAGTFSILDLATNTNAATIMLSSTGQPFGLVEHPGSGLVYVAGYGTNRLYVVDPQRKILITSIVVGNRPNAVALSPDGKFAYVSNGGVGAVSMPSSISIIDTVTNTVVSNVAMNPANLYLSGIAVHPDGSKVYVTSKNTGEILILDVATKTITKKLPITAHPFAVGDFIEKPVLSISRLTPEHNSLINNANPSFNIYPAADCGGQPCTLSENYFKSLPTSILLNP